MTTLTATLTKALHSALSDKTFNRTKLRTLVIGPLPTLGELGVWAFDRWEEYPGELELAEEAPSLRVPLTEWFHGYVELERASGPSLQQLINAPVRTRQEEGPSLLPPRAHPDVATQARLTAHVAQLDAGVARAISELASSGALGEFPQLVVFLQLKAGKQIAFPTAVYDARGGVAWPVEEERDDETFKALGATTAEGVVLFFPDAKQDGLEFKKGQRPVREYRFETCAYWTRPEVGEEHEGLGWRERKASFQVTLKWGYTSSDDDGSPKERAIFDAFFSHLKAHPELEFGASLLPLPLVGASVDRYFELVAAYGLSMWGAVKALSRRGGLDQVPAFLARVPADDDSRARLEGEYADALLAAGRFTEALAVYEALPKTDRADSWEGELDCLRGLGRFDAVLARVQKLKPKPGEDVPSGQTLRRAMALGREGKTDEALAVLATTDGGSDAERRWARAVILQQGDPKAAEQALRASFSEPSGWAAFAASDFAGAPDLVQAALREEAAVRTQLATQRKSWAPTRVDAGGAPDLVLSQQPDPKASTTPVAEHVLELGEVNEFCVDADTLWVTRAGEMASVGLTPSGAPARQPRQTHAARIDAIHARGGRLVFQADGSLFLAGQPVPLAMPLSRRGALASRGNWLVVEGKGALALIDVTKPGLVGTIALPEGAREEIDCAFLGDDVLVCVTAEGLSTVDVRDPSAPRPLAFLPLRIDDPSRLALSEQFAVVQGRGEEDIDSSRGPIAVIDLRSPGAPRCVARLSSPRRVLQVALDRGELLVLDTELRLFTLRLAHDALPQVVNVQRLPEDREQELDDRSIKGLLKRQGRVHLVTRKKLITLKDEPVVRDRTNDPSHGVTGLAPRLAQWVEERLREVKASHPDLQLGALVLERVPQRYRDEEEVRLRLTGPRSLAGFSAAIDPVATFSVAPAELPGGPAPEFYAPPKASNRVEGNERAEAEAWAWAREVGEALRLLAASQALEELASGRVYLCEGAHEIVVAVLTEPGRPWEPEPHVTADSESDDDESDEDDDDDDDDDDDGDGDDDEEKADDGD